MGATLLTISTGYLQIWRVGDEPFAAHRVTLFAFQAHRDCTRCHLQSGSISSNL